MRWLFLSACLPDEIPARARLKLRKSGLLDRHSLDKSEMNGIELASPSCSSFKWNISPKRVVLF